MTAKMNFSEQPLANQAKVVSQLQDSMKELARLLDGALTVACEGYNELAPSIDGLATGI